MGDTAGVHSALPVVYALQGGASRTPEGNVVSHGCAGGGVGAEARLLRDVSVSHMLQPSLLSCKIRVSRGIESGLEDLAGATGGQ